MPARNRRKYVRRSAHWGMRHIPATFRSRPADTRSGISWAMRSRPSRGGQVTTMDGQTHDIDKWDLLIAHPPCTYLTVTGNRWFNTERYGEKAVKRLQLREESAAFFLAFVNANVCKIAVENPVGYMSTHYRKPDCIIQPYEFGNHARKKTCLWLKGLPALRPTNIVDAGDILPGGYSVGASANYAKDETGKIMRWNDPRTAKARSKTFPGIAKAMAEQWGRDVGEEL